MTTGQRFSLAVLAPTINRTHGVNHVLCREPSARRDHGFSGRQSSNLAHDLTALGENGRAAGTMDRTVNSAAAEKRRIRRIHNRVRDFLGDIGRTVNFDSLAALQ